MSNAAQSKYQAAVDSIIEQLEKGSRPWRKPWTTISSGPRLPTNKATAKRYQGFNVPLLWCAAMERGFERQEWVGFNQAKAKGWNVRKGAKAETIFFFRTIEVDDREQPEQRKTIPLLRMHSVFNVAEIEGLPTVAPVEPVSLPPAADWHTEVLARINLKGGLVHGGGRAFYQIDTDAVHLPERSRFTSAAGYDATLLHELAHSSGAAHRLNRAFGKRFGDDAYKIEELCAELASVMVQTELGVHADIEGHASYLASWSELLKTQPKALLASASAASKAADLILGRQAEVAATE